MTFSAPRYCDLSFPHYRFIPGQFPHPTAHPQGHSYRAPGAPLPLVQFKGPDQWHESIDYLFGCDLYNHAYWWEAHEAWEGLWQLTDKNGPQGQFLQGLIQVSACHLKLHVGHLEGVRRLRQSSSEHLCAALRQLKQRCYMGLNTHRWLEQIAQYYDSRFERNAARPVHDSQLYPYILLQTAADS